MKTLLLTTTLFILSFSIAKASDSMLFPMYVEGVAMLRDGSRVNALFNYDMHSQRMMFLDNEGNPMVLVPGNVGSISIRGRVFIPAGNEGLFKERITINDQTLFVNHRVHAFIDRSRRTQGSAAFGANLGVQEVAASGQGIIVAGNSNVTIVNRHVEMEPDFRDDSSVFIHNGNRFIEINSLRALTRQFNRVQRAHIETFAIENNTNFRNVDDVVAITAYALSL